MYQNPFAIKPGEKLSPQQLFERWLDWSDYLSLTKSGNIKEGCDKDLHGLYLCCEDHVRLLSEIKVFDAYFHHLRMRDWNTSGFSINSLITMIYDFNLQISDDYKKKLLEQWGIEAILKLELRIL